MAVEDYFTGEKKMPVPYAVQIYNAVQKKQEEEGRQVALIEFFKAVKDNPMVAKKQRRKITVEPVKGVKVEASVEE
jgi:hypothetical protein